MRRKSPIIQKVCVMREDNAIFFTGEGENVFVWMSLQSNFVNISNIPSIFTKDVCDGNA